MMKNERGAVEDVVFGGFGILIVGGLIIGALFGIFFLFQWSKVYSQEQTGKAKLAEARYSKQVQLEEAKANLDSQKLNAEAEVIRAKGAAEAIAQERGSFSNDEYIRYLFVRDMDKLKTERVYIPTEAGIPILESGNRGSAQ